MAKLHAQLMGMSKTELIAEYDHVASATDAPTLAYYRDELFRRDIAEQNTRLEQMTNQIRWLTIVITVLTAASTYAVWRTLS